MKDEIRRRKELLANSLQNMTNTEKSFVRPSKFTTSKINQAMGSENKCGKSQEYFRTPIRKMNFTPNDHTYGARSLTYNSENRTKSGSRPRDSIKDFQKKLAGMERNRENLKSKMKKLKRIT
jgi:Skp family chaperone for outer membrane proteins